MKNRIFLISLVAVLIIGLFLGCQSAPSTTPAPVPSTAPAATPAKAIELKLDSPTTPPPAHTMSVALTSWIEMISQKTGGKVKITPFWGNTLTPQNQKWDSCLKGMSQIAYVPTPELAGRFPLQGVVALPVRGLNSGVARVRSFYDLYGKFPELKNEYKDVHLLWMFSSPLNGVGTKAPVKGLNDTKGMKIWTAGRVEAQAMQKVGFTPAEISMPEVYTSLQTGVIDGVNINHDQFLIRKFGEILKNFTWLDAATSANFAVVMNKEAWNGLPPDVQKVFDELSGLWGGEFLSKAWDESEAASKTLTTKQYGVEHIYLSSEEAAKWEEAVRPVALEYIKGLDDKGLPGTKMWDAVREFITKSK
jgi:TRAP-type transport system periplasmic protein